MFKPNDVVLTSFSSEETKRRLRLWAVTLVAGVVVSGIAVVVVLWVVRSYAYPHDASPTTRTTTMASEPWISGERLCDSVRQDAGYITLPNKIDGHYFFWFFESRSRPAQDPLVVWLAGEPGCSGLWSLLAENGPCMVERDMATRRNPHAWNTHANMIWLDQPVLTGFSYGRIPNDYDTHATDIGENLYWFLQGFFDRHPSLRGRDLFLAGEGYAGQFIPVAAHRIHRANEQLDARNASLHISLSGVMIGNGMTVPTVQYRRYLDMAVNNTYGIQLVSNSSLQSTIQNASACYSLLDDCQSWIGACHAALVQCRRDVMAALGNATRNPFDIRQHCASASERACYPTPEIDAFLNSARVRTYLSVRSRWIQCNRNVSLDFETSGDLMKDRHRYLSRLLDETKVRVLVYAGDADLRYNWQGNDAWTKQLVWQYTDEFNAATQEPFVAADGSQAGSVRAFGTRFTFLRVFQAGHFVAKDQPQVAQEMLQRFLRNESLARV